MHELPEEDSMQAKFNPSSCLPDIVSASTAFPLSGMVLFAQLATTSWFQEAAEAWQLLVQSVVTLEVVQK
jgi:hypothetical protein